MIKMQLAIRLATSYGREIHRVSRLTKSIKHDLREIRPAKVVLLQAAPMMKAIFFICDILREAPEPVAAGYLTGSHTNMSSPGLYFSCD